MSVSHRTELQKFLRNGGTIEQLKEKYAISVSSHKKYPNLLQFKYDQIESPFTEQIVRECRGIILDRDNNWAMVAHPFEKFFNYAEPLAAKIDWDTACVQEKLDGSLIIMYFYKGEWHVATSGTCDASSRVGTCNFSFAELFWKTFKEMGLTLPPTDGMCNVTFMFELMTPYNRVVVPHKESRIVLIGARYIGDLPCINDEIVDLDSYIDYPSVRWFRLDSIDAVLEALKSMNGLEQEGFVVVDCYMNRVKVKCDDYLKLHRLKSGFSLKTLADLVRTNESSEFLSYFPEYTELEKEVRTRYDKTVTEIEETYKSTKDIQSQKDFALQAVKTVCPDALFTMRKGKVSSAKEYISQIHIDSVVRLLHLEDIKIELKDTNEGSDVPRETKQENN